MSVEDIVENFMDQIEDTRINRVVHPIVPQQLKEEYPLTTTLAEHIISSRKVVESIIDGKDKRTLLFVGPCSIHDIDEAKAYADRLKALADKVKDNFFVVMRTYFQKPRTTLGWIGLISDPHINESGDKNTGLRKARELLIYLAEKQLPAGTEFLNTHTPQYIGDLITWACIGARNTESQDHRNLASGLSMPVGFKNSTDGNVKIAMDAVQRSHYGHPFDGTDMEGRPTVEFTDGNPYTHIILRGSVSRPNYVSAYVHEAQDQLRKEGLHEAVVIDCSHGNSGKDFRIQPEVFYNVVGQIVEGNKKIIGIMLESNLEEGNQSLPKDLHGFDKSTLQKGVSITDACINWETTRKLILDADKRLK